MWIVLVIAISLIALWIIGMNIDERFFGGRFLVRVKTSEIEFKASLEAVLSQKDRPLKDWELVPSDWINDKMNIPIQDRNLDKMREEIVRSINANGMDSRLPNETIQLIKEILRKLK